MWDFHMALGGIPDISPSGRRRAYSDPRQKRGLRLPLRLKSVSPTRIILKEEEAGGHQDPPTIPRSASPTSSGYGSGPIDLPFLPLVATAPMNIRLPGHPPENSSYSEGSPKRCSSPYAGLAVGSPLGSGPLNGHPLTCHAGLSPVAEISMSSPSNFLHSSSPPVDLLPMRRPRLSSLSEVPSVAPIPENSPLIDTPPRPPLRQESFEPLRIANIKRDLNINNSKGGIDYKTGDGQKHDVEKSKENSTGFTDGGAAGGASAAGGAGGGGGGGSFRQRAGTWSMANARRHKIKQDKDEEAAKQRQRRKSGDDLQTAAAAAQTSAAASGRKEGAAAPVGFFDSFRPRSKSDAKAILQTRVRRKSGDDILNVKEKKKDASPGFLDTFRPRSKSDASKGKKPNLMTTVKNAVQHSLVSPSGTTRSGRRSGEATPVEHSQQGTHNVYHTWHAGSGAKSTIGKVMDLFRRTTDSSEDRQRRKSGGKHDKGQVNRRHSMETDQDRRRHGSGSAYIRGEDPDSAALLFRESRRLPAAATFLENFKRSDLEENESQILVKFFKYHHTYDLIPTSAKLVIFDTRLQVKKAFYALVYNGVRAAPLWDAQRQEFVGMLTITDFIRILQSFYSSPNRKMEELEDHRLEMWRKLLNDDDRKLISISPHECLYEAIRSLIHHKIHRLPVIDPSTGNVLYIITHKRILKFLFLYISELPKPSILSKCLRELNIGTYENIETAKGETLIIEALNKFVERRISALPIVDDEGKLIDIYAKFDVINLAAEGTYHNLDITLQHANEYRNEWFEGVRHCNLEETMGVIMERIVRAEVHRLVVVDKSNKVIGIISLSDILNELVLKPCNDDPQSLKTRTVGDMESVLSGSTLVPSHHSEDSPDRDDLEDTFWSPPDDGPEEEKLQERKSSAGSEEEKFDMEVEVTTPTIPSDNLAQQQGAISISG